MWQHDLYDYHLLPRPWEKPRREHQEAKARGGKRQGQQETQNRIEELLLKVQIIEDTFPLNSDHGENFNSSIRKSVLVLNDSKQPELLTQTIWFV